ncbi:hypothetical protein [Dechloromonas denitrificans]|uniref:hypothetical protein n=1 Tax=Dechloromonas denitrificans TaxID=281362 RepID=UPI0012FBEF1D|nr:hypothetical protein [Dechloromonas denitrificans]
MAKVVGERGGSLHKRLIIGCAQGASGEVDQEISGLGGKPAADLTLSFRPPRYDQRKASVTMLFALIVASAAWCVLPFVVMLKVVKTFICGNFDSDFSDLLFPPAWLQGIDQVDA